MAWTARIVRTPPTNPVITVDGALGAPGLELSHWPGNRTPAELRHELSTGSALLFARRPEEERLRLAAGATEVVNNHYDTDGLCATWAVLSPRAALESEVRLLQVAACGDFYRVPSELAFQIDAAVGGLADPERSPLAKELRGLEDLERWNRAQAFGLEALPGWLRGDVSEVRELWERPLEELRSDLADLERAHRAEHPELDLTVWTSARGARSSRSAASAFDPGRHALFGSSERDRVLAVGPSGDGTTWRLVLSTLSWFDLPGPRRPERPDLAALVARLNELEGRDPADRIAWRSQAADNPAPELWYGTPEVPSFAQHSDALHPSRLAPRRVMEELRARLEPRPGRLGH